MHTLINIITRTSNRPNGFKKNLESIRNQTYKNINHIICTDDENSVNYIEELGVKDYHLIEKKKRVKFKASIDGKKFPHAPYNLYFNEMHKFINSGWIIYLDDDDVFYSEDSVSKVVEIINKKDEDTMIIWKMVYSDQQELPEDISDSNPPQLYKIGGSCLTFHSKYINQATWDTWKCSDFRVISKLWACIPKSYWFPERIVYVPSIGLGQKKDIE